MTYQPENLDFSNITLSEDLQKLVEKLASNQHDVWAKKKKASGYEYGEKHKEPKFRNGKLIKKGTHPDLVPYDELSEEKKDYDRENVIITIKGIIAAGYMIKKNK